MTRPRLSRDVAALNPGAVPAVRRAGAPYAVRLTLDVLTGETK